MSARDPSELLSDDLQRVLTRYRDGTAPTEQVRARLWLRLAGPGVGTVAATSTVLRVIIGGAIAGAIAVGIVASSERGEESRSRERVVQPERPNIVVAEPPVSVALPPTTAALPTASLPAERVAPSRDRMRANAPVVAIEQVPSLAEEIAVLERARIALGRDDPQGALQILAEHERRFAEGTLVEERGALRILALCSGTDGTRGRDEARRFLAAHPTAALAARIRVACDDGTAAHRTSPR